MDEQDVQDFFLSILFIHVNKEIDIAPQSPIIY